MEFHEWTSLYDSIRPHADRDRFPPAEGYYREIRSGPIWQKLPQWTRIRHENETRWYREGRPYYSVYPSIVEPFTRLRLDIDSGAVPSLPVPELAVRFAKGHELRFESSERCVRAMLLSLNANDQGERDLIICSDFDVSVATGLLPDSSAFQVPLRTGTTFERMISDTTATIAGASRDAFAEMTTLLKLACTLCLLGDDPEVLEPDVLAKDREKWERTGDPAIVERAVRRGKRGWLVGAKIEVLPHVRRPHMALRWTGPGGATPRIVPVKGSIVHREIVERLPTGRLDAETKPNQE